MRIRGGRGTPDGGPAGAPAPGEGSGTAAGAGDEASPPGSCSPPRRAARLRLDAGRGGGARRGPADARLPRARSLVVRLSGAGPLAAADPYRALTAPGGAGRLARRDRVRRRRAPLADAESPCLHRAAGRAARAAVGSLGAAGSPAARRDAVRRAGGGRRARGALRLADDRAGPVLGGAGRPVGAPRREPVGGGSGPAARLGGRGMAGEPAGGRGEHRCGPADRRPRRPDGRRGAAGGVRPVRRGGGGVGTPAAERGRGQDRRRTAGCRGGAGQRGAPPRPG